MNLTRLTQRLIRASSLSSPSLSRSKPSLPRIKRLHRDNTGQRTTSVNPAMTTKTCLVSNHITMVGKTLRGAMIKAPMLTAADSGSKIISPSLHSCSSTWMRLHWHPRAREASCNSRDHLRPDTRAQWQESREEKGMKIEATSDWPTFTGENSHKPCLLITSRSNDQAKDAWLGIDIMIIRELRKLVWM